MTTTASATIALTSFALNTAKDTGSDTATAVRHMRDEPQEVALAVGCTAAQVIAWCDSSELATFSVPATREAAIAALVEQDVARWGEGERAASQRAHSRLTWGLALNTLACRAARVNDPDESRHREAASSVEAKALRAAAKAALTAADRERLHEGG